MNLKKNKKKIINIYSITDWDYHNGKVSWDDFFDEKGKFFLTVATMKMAKKDGFLPDYVNKESFPKRIFIQERDKSWTVYENVEFFTPEKVQKLLNDLGKLTEKKFIFKYKVVPEWWQRRLAKMKRKSKIKQRPFYEQEWLKFQKRNYHLNAKIKMG